MLFEVMRADKVLMRTNHEECIPPIEILRSMEESGHAFRMYGKPYKPPKARNRKANNEVLPKPTSQNT